jgi:hypothetical protein
MILLGNLGVGEEEESSFLVSLLVGPPLGLLDYGESVGKSGDTKVGYDVIIYFHNFSPESTLKSYCSSQTHRKLLLVLFARVKTSCESTK